MQDQPHRAVAPFKPVEINWERRMEHGMEVFVVLVDGVVSNCYLSEQLARTKAERIKLKLNNY